MKKQTNRYDQLYIGDVFLEDFCFLNMTSENELAGGTRAQNLSLPIELSAEKIQDFQASFSLMDTRAKGFISPDDLLQVAKAAGSFQ